MPACSMCLPSLRGKEALLAATCGALAIGASNGKISPQRWQVGHCRQAGGKLLEERDNYLVHRHLCSKETACYLRHLQYRPQTRQDRSSACCARSKTAATHTHAQNTDQLQWPLRAGTPLSHHY